MSKSLRLQILGLLGGSLVLVLIIALACFNFLSGNVQSYRSLLEGPVRASQFVDEANLQFKVQVQEWKNVLLRGKASADRDKFWGQFEEQERKVQSTLGLLAEMEGTDQSLKSQVQALQQAHRTLGTAYRTGRDAFIAAGNDASAGDAAVKGVDRPTSEQMAILVDQLHKSSDAQSVAISQQADRTILTGAVVMLVSALLVGLLALWIVNRNLVAPIRMLIEYVAQLSEGKFAARVDVTRQDELGRLAVAANTLRDFLADTFSRLKRSTTDLDTAGGELNAIAELMAQGTHEQFERTDQVATAMTEMSATAQEVARHAAHAARAADEADQSAQDGEKVMQSTIATITRMRSEISSTANVIQRLETDSGRIGKVLEVIRGIADQTNLLALNAAIEAARAGEAGRGFAVVADEVRTLAQRTAVSTAEINQIINSVQTGASDAVQAIQGGQAHSEESVEQVTHVGATLQRITVAVENIRDMNRQIATAAEEQTSVAEDISRNLTEITAIAVTNQDNVKRTQNASHELKGLSAGLNDVISRLSA
ncbi:methyl-accepting chemotaxis protein [Pseudomonas savastanoi]|uniref:Chemotaxis protein n=1 Tax=Pseudomonas savastanoi pv. savastanoi NCPPB 3335 TaxID=693985 RepID=A0ABC8BLB8_PSESS|nr:methyl-accepting chemotaxis protein [Pseudomonas savastanoi]ARD14604.1 chemotaxis protein [Pseudomonas savastanoi pv. savastanoi NCPPB 3335]MBA4706116.1 HAMP domain-containing protein [Pseudomonas savastanoi pv. savastanoi]